MFGNTIFRNQTDTQAQVLAAQSCLDQARFERTEQNFEVALNLYGQAKVAFKDANQATPILSKLKRAFARARTSQTPEEDALRQRIADVYYERAEILETLGRPGEAQASRRKALAWDYNEIKPAFIFPAVSLSMLGALLDWVLALRATLASVPLQRLPVVPARAKSAQVDYLFEKALSTLGSLEVSNKPSLFLIYAHDNPAYGQAKADTSKYLINKLSQIQVNLYSDQTPMGKLYLSSPEDLKKDGKLEDILTSQLCLLPDPLRDDVKPVDKVVVCCSELLGKYLGWSHYEKFYQQIQEAYLKDREAYRKNGAHVGAPAIRQVIRQFSQEEAYKAEFHHVLTEMAFLQIRAEQRKDQHGIIPISLTPNSYENCLAHFIPATTVRMEDILRFDEQAKAGREVYPNQGRHWVLFKLIERLLVSSDEAKTFLKQFWQGYSDLISRLNSECSTSGDLEFVKLVDSIFDDIRTELHIQLASIVQQAQKPLPPNLSLPEHITQSGQWVVETLLEKLQKENTRAAHSRYELPAVLGVAADIEKLYTTYLHNLQHLDEVQNALTLYTPTEGSINSFSDKRFSLQNKVDEFLGSDKQVLLLLGEAGSGKSTFNRHLTDVLWERYKHAPESGMLIPLFIALAEYPPMGKDLIATYLERQGFDQEAICTLRKHPFVFILDGFDEIKDRSQSLYTQTQIHSWKGKIIVSSRPEYLHQGYETLFQQREQTTALEKYWLTPISDQWIQNYIEKYVNLKKDRINFNWEVENYQNAFNELPTDVKGILRRPFLLRMALELLPSLSTNHATQSLTRIGLYDAFLKQWWERSEKRLCSVALNEAERDAWEELSRHLHEDGPFTCEDMAVSLHKENCLYASFTRQRQGNEAVPAAWNRYFSKDATSRLLLFNAPLVRENDRYRFIHKSIQDYLVARSICGLNFGASEPDVEATLNQFSIVNEPLILDFLVERLKQQPPFKSYLWRWLEASKNPQQNVAIGAANAATILAYAAESFSGRDLQGIRIPGANLSHSICDNTQFQGADLQGVIFEHAWLRQANFDRVQMQGVHFGQKTDIQFPIIDTFVHPQEFINYDKPLPCYSPDKRYILNVDKTGQIVFYEESSREWRAFGKGTFNASRMIISANSERVLLKDGGLNPHESFESKLELWSPVTKQSVLSIEPKNHIYKMALCEVGQLFAVAGEGSSTSGEDAAIKVWSAEVQEPIRTFKARNVTSLAISSKCATVAFCKATTITIASLNSEVLYTLSNLVDAYHLAISTDGRWLAAESRDSTVHIWSLETQELVHSLKGHTGAILTLAISPNNQWIASGSRDKTIKLWSLHTGKCIRTFTGHQHAVETLGFSEDGGTLHSLSIAKGGKINEPGKFHVIKRWPLDKLEVGNPPPQIFHKMYQGLLSPDGLRIAAVDAQNILWLHTTDRSFSQKIGNASPRVEGAYHMTFSPDTQWLLYQHTSSEVVCHSLTNTPAEHRLDLNKGDNITFSADSQRLIILNNNKDYYSRVYSLQEGKFVDEFKNIENLSTEKFSIFSSNAESFFTISNIIPHGILKRSARTGEIQKKLNPFSNNVWINNLLLLPNEQRLALIDSRDGADWQKNWERRRALEKKDLDPFSSNAWVNNLLLSPKEQWLALIDSRDGTDWPESWKRIIALYSLQAEQIKHQFIIQTLEHFQAIFSPNEKWLAVATQEQLALYSTISGKLEYSIEHNLVGKIKRITWKKDKILITDKVGEACLWQVVLDDNSPTTCHVQMIFSSSSITDLMLEHASIAGTQGLAQDDIALFKQFNANGEPAR